MVALLVGSRAGDGGVATFALLFAVLALVFVFEVLVLVALVLVVWVFVVGCASLLCGRCPEVLMGCDVVDSFDALLGMSWLCATGLVTGVDGIEEGWSAG